MKYKWKSILSFIVLNFLSIQLFSQEVITSTGGYGITSNAHVTWTIGEPVTETAEGLNNILTQGFNQESIIITTIKENEFPDLKVKVFPNPASDKVKLVVEKTDSENLRYILFDLNGKPVSESRISGTETFIPVGNLSPSTYLLKIFNNNSEISIFKIIKK